MIWLELTCYRISGIALFFINLAMTDRNVHSIVIQAIAESICTHYSNLSGRPDIFLGSGTLNIRDPAFCKKQGAKKQGHCYSKRGETRLPLLFLNNNDLVFCTLLFSKSRVPDFQEQWVQIDWAKKSSNFTLFAKSRLKKTG